MDLQPERREQNMARWTFAGSLGVFIGPILLSGAAYISFGWRGMFLSLALLSTFILVYAWNKIPNDKSQPVSFPRFKEILDQFILTFKALRNWTVVRWLILLEFSDLMLDVLYAFLPLYFVDVANFTPAQAALSVAIWTGVGLLGDFLLIPLVERVNGLDYLSISVVIELILFPVFLLSPQAWLKLISIALMGFFNSGWYAILKANLFESMHGQNGAVLTLDNVSGLFGKLIPFGIGLAAQAFGIGMAMWILLAGPIALFIGLPKNMTPDTSIYLHIPFCKHRCAYCDFNTYAGQEDSIPDYVTALINEIETVSKLKPNPINVHTVFFGGGTPSLLSALQFDSILRALHAAFTFTADAEISIEANPGTISPEELNSIRKSGINRISFGVQSANSEELRMLERIHDFFTVIEAVSTARKAGFDNLNLDLIYGLPEQTLSTWQTTLHRIVDLHPEHISAYALTLEHGTPFGRWSAKGLLPLPDPDLAAEMYEYAEEFLASNGYVHYEISNWAKPNHECKHNLQYWHSLPYLAFGAGAHGYANGYRYSNVLRIKTYIDRLVNLESRFSNIEYPLSPATVNQHKQTLKDDISEYMLNNLRLTNAGVAESDFRLRFGSGLLDVYPKEIEELIQNGLLEKKTSESQTNSDVYRLTKHGRLLGNQVFMRFV